VTERRHVEQRLWRAFEAIHAVVYFAPEAKPAYTALGLRGYWMGYFASRSAALGAASPQLVTALFYNFAPRVVFRALPDAWAFATPEAVLACRTDLARTVLDRLLDGTEVNRVAEASAVLVAGLDLAGRPLAAAHAALPAPEDPVGRLWWAATVLREYRGDGHVALLTAARVDGVEAHAWHTTLPENQREMRGWMPEEWAAAADRLRARGWLDAGGRHTAGGATARADLEHATDDCAAPALAPLDDAAAGALLAELRPLAARIAAAGGVTYPNPTGVGPVDG